MFCLKDIVPEVAKLLREHGFVELTFDAGYGIGVSASVEVTKKRISAYGGIGAGLGYGVSLAGGVQAGSSSGWQLRGSVSGGEIVGGEVSGTVSQGGLGASGGLGAGLGAGATVTGGYETTIVPFDHSGAAESFSSDACGCV